MRSPLYDASMSANSPPATTALLAAPSMPATGLPETGRLVAVVVGLENYKSMPGGLPKVHYAHRDAEAFAATLKTIYPADRSIVRLLVDDDATLGGLKYELGQIIKGLKADDLFVFYYAGHGYHGAGGNRLSVWDTHAHNVEDMTLRVSDVLIDPLSKSPCRRALAFIDACALGFTDLVPARDVLADLDPAELVDFLTTADYAAIFTSCQPGQRSYGSDQHRHGIWTYFLLRALKGEDDRALGPDRVLTDTTLRDYLRLEVPRFLSNHTEIRGQQDPQAWSRSGATFLIRHVPEPQLAVAPAGDLTRVGVAATREYLERVESAPFRKLPGFVKGPHFTPDRASSLSDAFVAERMTETVNEELQALYDKAKAAFGLRRRDVGKTSGGGQGNIDTTQFRFTLATRQNPDDPGEYQIIRQLELREGGDPQLAKLDQVFGWIFDRVVIEAEGFAKDYDELVDLFEDVQAAHGGTLRDEEHLQRITYAAQDGVEIRLDVGECRVEISAGGRQRCSELIGRVRGYRLGLSQPGYILLG